MIVAQEVAEIKMEGTEVDHRLQAVTSVRPSLPRKIEIENIERAKVEKLSHRLVV
jgi:hypothetical protein